MKRITLVKLIGAAALIVVVVFMARVWEWPAMYKDYCDDARRERMDALTRGTRELRDSMARGETAEQRREQEVDKAISTINASNP